MEKLPKIESAQKSSQEPEIETWEDEGGAVDTEKPTESKKERKLKKLRTKKKEIMNQLHSSIQNLDQGEPIDEFRDETRKIIYFNKENQKYFIEKNGGRKTIGIGDVVSDYAWEIKYVPDGEMIEPAYRILAKKILTNEARRDIEQLYDRELVQTFNSGMTIKQPLIHLEQQWKKWEHGPRGEGIMTLGLIAEISVREMLNRIALNNKLGFAILRVNAVEDSIYKYDFKIRVSQRNRGVKIKQGNTEGGQKKSDTGIQFGLVKPKYAMRKAKVIEETKEKFNTKLPVNDILLVTIQTEEFAQAFNRWLKEDKPSGGPEQFLSPELKRAILKAVTEKLTEIPQEVFDKL